MEGNADFHRAQQILTGNSQVAVTIRMSVFTNNKSKGELVQKYARLFLSAIIALVAISLMTPRENMGESDVTRNFVLVPRH